MTSTRVDAPPGATHSHRAPGADADASGDLDYMMTDHLAWSSRSGGRSRVFAADGASPVFVQVKPCGCVSHSGPLPIYDTFSYSAGPCEEALERTVALPALTDLGRVGRFRNPSLWDCIATAITRQVVRAAQARIMYTEFCLLFGDEVSPSCNATANPECRHTSTRKNDFLTTPSFDNATPPEPYWLFPTPEVVLTLTDEDFASSGMAFKRRALRSAATAYLAHRTEWLSATPGELLAALQRVPYIGPWTAAAAVADHSNEWSLYAYSDLAVRTWATRAIPERVWANDETLFADQWRQMSGRHLASVTLLTLAWGDQHVHSINGYPPGRRQH